MKRFYFLLFLFFIGGCNFHSVNPKAVDSGLIPAETFSNSIKKNSLKDYSVYRNGKASNGAVLTYASNKKDLELKKSYTPPSPKINDIKIPPPKKVYSFNKNLPHAPYGSSSPYKRGQMGSNASLFKENGFESSLFRDFRAHSPMDIITITINESSSGKKKADTDASTSFDLLAGISSFFGIETRKWAANNKNLNPSQMLQANSSLKFEGEGETKRSGTLKAKISAVIMEELPNGLFRIEGTKIVGLNAEEEILVISGLVRQRDIDAFNQIDSNKIANMRIDFYGQGVIAERQKPGWGARIFEAIWPF